MDEGAELKHGVTCLRSRTIENSLMSLMPDRGSTIGRLSHGDGSNLLNDGMTTLKEIFKIS